MCAFALIGGLYLAALLRLPLELQLPQNCKQAFPIESARDLSIGTLLPTNTVRHRMPTCPLLTFSLSFSLFLSLVALVLVRLTVSLGD